MIYYKKKFQADDQKRAHSDPEFNKIAKNKLTLWVMLHVVLSKGS